MIEGKVIGLGAAYVDAKIQSPNLCLPLENAQLPEFLDIHQEARLSPGGSLPNIMTAFARLSNYPNLRLLACVGNDVRGSFYAENTDGRFGQPQVSTVNPTGVWVGIYNDGVLVESLDFYGAAGDIYVSGEELHYLRNQVFITDIDACRVAQSADSVKKVVDKIETKGIFVLSLSGTEPQTNVQELLSFTGRNPDVIFGNARELSHITGGAEINQGIQTVFPENKLVVITHGEKGTLIRFDKQSFQVPAMHIPKGMIIDEEGAGDSYMGAMLAVLLQREYRDWNEYSIKNGARMGAFASSLVIQRSERRLTKDDARFVLDYIKK